MENSTNDVAAVCYGRRCINVTILQLTLKKNTFFETKKKEN